MATIEKRGPSYMARVNIKTPSGYKRKSKSGFKTKSAAKVWATEQESLKFQGRLATGSNTLFADYFEQWYKLYKTDITENSLRWYKHAHKLIKEFLPFVTLDQLNRPIMQEFFNTIGGKFAYSTSKKMRMYVRGAIRNAIYDDIITKDATEGVVLTGTASKDRDLKFLEAPQMKQLIDYIQSIKPENRSASDEMILVGIETGARYQEVAALTWQDLLINKISINKAWEQHSEIIKETKTVSSNRIIDVPNKLIDDLQLWHPDHKPEDFIFSYDGQKPLSSVAPNKRLKFILTAIHSPKIITFHGLRHTHASWLLANNVDIQYVSERLGHSNVNITLSVYTHLLSNKRTNEINKSVGLLTALND
ncbi:tyrosine-type recombinase/integrase [Pediococcus pentosaceus]|uniref:tyrosine-type recombinase/integrase n=1 Tax=Pediococcus pentosaceus TaxID=1255 RepID=UPI003981D898